MNTQGTAFARWRGSGPKRVSAVWSDRRQRTSVGRVGSARHFCTIGLRGGGLSRILRPTRRFWWAIRALKGVRVRPLGHSGRVGRSLWRILSQRGSVPKARRRGPRDWSSTVALRTTFRTSAAVVISLQRAMTLSCQKQRCARSSHTKSICAVSRRLASVSVCQGTDSSAIVRWR